ncbi:hypothetical protein Ciccas_003439 [Cichlidogyrus casuarinus]|uniref:Uncharacterized protein n=1 Tax=Cichlidogyrus casuarinus TaxID=1844966 RepID=A0ABD2QEJ4_9PLAT
MITIVLFLACLCRDIESIIVNKSNHTFPFPTVDPWLLNVSSITTTTSYQHVTFVVYDSKKDLYPGTLTTKYIKVIWKREMKKPIAFTTFTSNVDIISTRKQTCFVYTPKPLEMEFKSTFKAEHIGKAALLFRYAELDQSLGNYSSSIPKETDLDRCSILSRNQTTFAIYKFRVKSKKSGSISTFIQQSILGSIVAIASAALGLDFSWSLLKNVCVANPRAVLTPLSIQFLLGPLLAFIVSRSFSNDYSMGILTTFSLPDAGLSHFWIYTLKGDTRISMAFGIISILVSLVVYPILFLLDALFSHPVNKFKLLFIPIIVGLVLLTLMLLASMGLSSKIPRLASFLSRMLRYFLIMHPLFVFFLGFYSYDQVMRLCILYWGLIVTIILIEIGFFLLGLMCAKLLYPKFDAVNAIIYLNMNPYLALCCFKFLPSPDAEMASIFPWIITLIISIAVSLTALPYRIVYNFRIMQTRHQNLDTQRMVEINKIQ